MGIGVDERDAACTRETTSARAHAECRAGCTWSGVRSASLRVRWRVGELMASRAGGHDHARCAEGEIFRIAREQLRLFILCGGPDDGVGKPQARRATCLDGHAGDAPRDVDDGKTRRNSSMTSASASCRAPACNSIHDTMLMLRRG